MVCGVGCMKENVNERNYGIDLLRIIAMFMIIMLHSLLQGGILNNLLVHSVKYKLVWLIEIIAYPAVNIFAIISGYVGYSDRKKEIKYANYIKLWLEVVFYSLLITILFDMFLPNAVICTDYIKAILPVTNDSYWYFSAYTALFIVMPIINNGIRNTNIKTIKLISILIITFFTIVGRINDPFKLTNGYSFAWILLLYILGSAIKKCKLGKNMKNYQIILGIILLYVITYLNKMYSIILAKNLLVSYISPTMLLISMLYVIGFSRIKLNKRLIKIVNFSAPSVFAAYLLNTNNLIWEYIIKDFFFNLTMQSVNKLIIAPIIISFGFLVLAILIDKLRKLLFNFLHVPNIINKGLRYFKEIF